MARMVGEMKRRGFFGVLAGLFVAPVVAKESAPQFTTETDCYPEVMFTPTNEFNFPRDSQCYIGSPPTMFHAVTDNPDVDNWCWTVGSDFKLHRKG